MDPLILFHKRIQQYSTLLPSHYLREYISKNPAITIQMVLQDIERNPRDKEEWRFESLCLSIPLEELVANNILPTRDTTLFSPLVIAMKITIDTILKTHMLLEYNWAYLIQHPSVYIEDILTHPELPWNYTYVICNPNFRYHHIPLFRHYMDDASYRQLFFYISRTATFEEIMEHPDEPWFPGALSSEHIKKEHFPILLPYFQEKHKSIIQTDKYCLQTQAIRNPNLTFEDLLELFADQAFDYAYGLPRFSADDYMKYKHKWNHPVNFYSVLPLSVIQSYPYYPQWNYELILSCNITLSYESLKEIPKKVNERDAKLYLFNNKHISYVDKKRLLEELLPKPYSNVHFTVSYKRLIESPLFLEPTFEEIKEYFAKKRMIRIIVECMTNPTYQQCRKRLIREHGEISTLK